MRWHGVAQVTGETNKVRFGGVNSRVNWDIPEKFGVTSYPWIASFYEGKKIEDMRGLSGAQSVVNFAKEQMKNTNPVGEEPQLRSPNHPPPGPQSSRAGAAAGAAAAASSTQAGTSGAAVDDGKPLIYGGENADSYSELPWREQLGRHTWFYLHTLAATYPQFPTEEDKAGVRMLMASLGQLFPCKLCRRHLQGNLADPKLGPVAVESREALSVWMCKLHNTVNVQNNKPEFPCDQVKLDLMYLKNCNECKEKFEDGEAHKAAVLLSPAPLSRLAPAPLSRALLCARTHPFHTSLSHIAFINFSHTSLSHISFQLSNPQGHALVYVHVHTVTETRSDAVRRCGADKPRDTCGAPRNNVPTCRFRGTRRCTRRTRPTTRRLPRQRPTCMSRARPTSSSTWPSSTTCCRPRRRRSSGGISSPARSSRPPSCRTCRCASLALACARLALCPTHSLPYTGCLPALRPTLEPCIYSMAHTVWHILYAGRHARYMPYSL